MHPLTEILAAALLAVQPPAEELQEFCPLFMVFFDEGSVRLSPQARSILDNWAEFARRAEAPYNRYTIETATDPAGSTRANLELSWRRGLAILDYLTSRGFAAERFRIRALGETDQPWVRPETPPQHALAERRRAVMILETTLSNMRRVSGNAVC
ncbi:MAG: hypothetical protein QOC65_421 [Sphingomonadales bacterium]|nr:hypothetical protein [Sphingomonadales bacterium]